MHENRETSATSERESGAERPEKADSRKTGVNGAEESDLAVVLVNQPNKAGEPEGEPAAEGGEGRARTKESISQTHTNPTQSGRKKSVSQGLAGVRQVARARKGERFTALPHHLTRELLLESFYALKREAAAGIDGVRWKEYEEGLEGRLEDLHSRRRSTFWASRTYAGRTERRATSW